MTSIKFGTLNVKGMGEMVKRKQIYRWVRQNSIDICFLQETHSTKVTEHIWTHQWGYKAIFSGNSSNSCGVGVLFNNTFPLKIINTEEVEEGRLLIVKIEVEDKQFTLVNIYGPNSDNTNFFQKLTQFIGENEEDRFIIGGDFNVVIDPDLDKKGGIKNRNIKSRRSLQILMENYDLCDIWRTMNEDKKQYTWESNHNPPIKCRLDFFLISSNILNNFTESKINTSIKTDHNLVTCNMVIHQQKRGPGYFKVNNSLILDMEYQETIRRNIELSAEENKEANPNTLWEVLKGVIRNETIKYASKKKQMENKEEKQLQVQLEELNEKLLNDSKNEELINEIKQKKVKLETIYDKKTRGTIIRSKARWIEGGEKNTKYFANLEKRNYESKIIHSLNCDGNVISDPKLILEEEKSFYQNLYEEKPQEISDYDFFPDNYSKKLSEEEKNKCEGYLTAEECRKALKQMQNNKSPGSDGITVEFYKIFWNDLEKYYIDSINYSYEIEELTVLQKQGLITLLPKKNKDLTKLSNWRPISLLNVDYKIATKAIANRIKLILPSIIHCSQTGFVAGRYIGENIRLLFDVIEYTEDNEIPGLLFFTDFEKAFDSLNQNYIFKTLDFLNFGPSLSRWIKTFYKNNKSSIYSNGHLSRSFNINRGVRQGCPLSPYLFIIGIELLSYSIRHDKDIGGILMYDKEIKNIFFADDATMILDGTEKTVQSIIYLIEEFYKISGLKLNTSKSIMLRIGSLKNTDVKFCENKDINWTSENAQTLGIIFSTDKRKLLQLNFEPKLKEFRTCLNTWRKRNLTVLGKIVIIKSFALPKLIYPFMMLPNPKEEVLQDITRTLYNFLWNSNTDKISRKIIVQDIENGGLKMINIPFFLNALKASWVKRILDNNNNGLWKTTYTKLLEPLGGTFFFNCNCSNDHIKKLVPKNQFFIDVLEAWCKINFKEPDLFLQQSVWMNSKLLLDNKPFFIRRWYDLGIKYVKDFIYQNEKRFYSFEEFKLKYQINDTDFLYYHRIVKSIPNEWKETLFQNVDEINLGNKVLLAKVKSISKVTKLLYNEQINVLKYDIKAHNKWESHFNDGHLNWSKIHELPFRCTIDTKLRFFQYKFIMRIIATNKFLLKCKKTTSNLCDFCYSNVETQIHLFFDCAIVQHFWGEFQQFLKTKNIDIELNRKIVCFGTEQIANEQIINHLIIQAKYFIYTCKLKNIEPTITYFKHVIKQTQQIEKIIAFKNDKIEQHNKKWGQLIAL